MNQAPYQGAYLGTTFFINNEEVMEKVGLTTGLKDKTFIIQGIGKLGKPLAELFISEGAICVGVRDHDGYIYNANGINFEQLCDCKSKTGSIVNFESTKPCINDTIFTEQCDILILAATQKSLICYTADNVKAKVIVEAGDGSITPSAHRILTGRSKLVLPDLFICCGGPIAAYLEYIRNMFQFQGVYDETLKMSNKIYESYLDNLVAKEQTIAVGGSSTVSTSSLNIGDRQNALGDTLKFCIKNIGKDILSFINIYNLGTDIKTATYMIAINNILKTVLSEKK